MCHNSFEKSENFVQPKIFLDSTAADFILPYLNVHFQFSFYLHKIEIHTEIFEFQLKYLNANVSVFVLF